MVRYTVALDHTPHSWRALEWIDATVIPTVDSVRLVTISTFGGESRLHSGSRLQIAESRLAHHHPRLSVTRWVVGEPTTGAPANGEVLVIGTGRPAWHSGVGRRLLEHATGPVVVVPERWSAAPGSVVVGIDGQTGGAALQFAADTAGRSGTTLVMVRSWVSPAHVSPYGMVYLASDRAIWEHESQLELDAAMRAVNLTHPDLRTRGELHQGRPDDVLVRAGGSATLIVVGRHHHSMLETILLGSVGRRVMLRSRTPVCVVAPVPARPSAPLATGPDVVQRD